MQSGICVAIVTRNRANSLIRCLKSLVKQSTKPYKVLVVDNGSDDNTKDVVKKFASLPITYLREPRIGIPFARNLALKEAKGKVIAFMDDDCEAEKKWIEHIQDAYIKYPRVAAIQGAMVPVPRNSLLALYAKIHHFKWFFRNTKKNGEIVVGDARNLSFRVSVLRKEKIKFDNAFYRGQDVDLVKQVTSRGYKVIYEPRIKVIHWERSNLLSFLKQRYQFGKSSQRYIDKWPAIVLNKNQIGDWRICLDKEEQLLKNLNFFDRIRYKIIFILAKIVFATGAKEEIKNPVINSPSQPPVKNSHFSLIIIIDSVPNLLDLCLLSVIRQTVLPKEVTIVSRYPLPNILPYEARLKKLTLLNKIFINKEQSMPLILNNIMKKSKSELMGIISGSELMISNWIEQMIKVHLRSSNKTILVKGILGWPNNLWSPYFWKSNIRNENEGNIQQSNSSLQGKYNFSIKLRVLVKEEILFDTKLGICSELDLVSSILIKGLKYKVSKNIISNPNPSLIKLFSNLKESFLYGYYYSKYEFKHLKNSNTFWPAEMPKENRSSIIYQFHFNLSNYFFSLSRYFSGWKISNDYNRLKQEPKIFNQKTQNIQLTKLKISIMIITKDTYENLYRCLRSLQKQTIKPFEIIIIDASIKRSFKKSDFSDLAIKYIPTDKAGYSLQRNLALNFAKGDILAAISGDCEASKEWIESIQLAYKRRPNVTAIQGRIESRPSNSILASIMNYRSQRWFLNCLDNEGNIDCLVAKNLSFRINEIKKNNIQFPETYLYNKFGGEDIFFSYLLILKNLKVIYDPSIAVHHWEHTSFKKFIQELLEKGQNAALLNYDWRELRKRLQVNKFIQKHSDIFPYLKIPKISFYKLPFFVILFLIGKFFNQQAFIKQYARLVRDAEFPAFYSLVLNKMNDSLQYEDLSVAVITRNRSDSLNNLLLSICYQIIKPAQMIIIDNGSSDQTKKIVQNFHNHLNIIYDYEPEKGISQSRNKALKLSKTPYLAFLDDDCIIPSNWTAKVIEAHLKYPQSAAIQGQSLSLTNSETMRLLVQYHRNTWMRSFLKVSWITYYKAISGRLKKSLKIGLIDTRNVSLNMRFVRKNKLTFDNSLVRSADFDFGRKIIKYKGFIIFYPAILVFHNERDNFYAFLKQTFERGRGLMQIKIKWAPSLVETSFFNRAYAYYKFLKTRKYSKNIYFLIGSIWAYIIFIQILKSGELYQKFVISKLKPNNVRQ